jgi:hypothetical protein
MISFLPLFVEAALALALVGVAVLLVRVDRRLAALRAGSDASLKAAAELAEAVARAETALRGMKTATAEAGVTLQRQIDEARAAADDLKFLSSASRTPALPEPADRPAPIWLGARSTAFDLWEGLE